MSLTQERKRKCGRHLTWCLWGLLSLAIASAPAGGSSLVFPVGAATTDAAPVDASGAVGPDDLVSMTNYEFTVLDRAGRPRHSATLTEFWEGVFPTQPPVDPFDPRIVWNPHRNRFVAASLVGGEETGHPDPELLIAVSETSNPAGAWRGHRYSVAPDEWLDFANLGFNRRWVAVQVDLRQRNDPAAGTEDESLASWIYVFEAATLEGTTPAVPEIFKRPVDPNLWTGYEIPALTYSTRDDLYLAQTNSGDDTAKGWLALYRLHDPGTGVELEQILPEMGTTRRWTNEPPSFQLLPQMDSTVFLQTSGDYVQSVVERAGKLWVAHTVYLPLGIGARSSVQWWEIDIGAGPPAVAQVGRVDDPRAGSDPTGRLFSYPSLAVNKNGDVVVGFGVHATDLFASAGFAARKAGDPPNTMRGPTLLRVGEGAYVTEQQPGEHWSDYTSTVVDPLDDETFWTLQVVAARPSSPPRWRLFWARVP